MLSIAESNLKNRSSCSCLYRYDAGAVGTSLRRVTPHSVLYPSITLCFYPDKEYTINASDPTPLEADPEWDRQSWRFNVTLKYHTREDMTLN